MILCGKLHKYPEEPGTERIDLTWRALLDNGAWIGKFPYSNFQYYGYWTSG